MSRLHSWKEIAGFLKVTTRTAQKWEKERGLPVHRMEEEKGRVFADIAELQAWKMSGGIEKGSELNDAVDHASVDPHPGLRATTTEQASGVDDNSESTSSTSLTDHREAFVTEGWSGYANGRFSPFRWFHQTFRHFPSGVNDHPAAPEVTPILTWLLKRNRPMLFALATLGVIVGILGFKSASSAGEPISWKIECNILVVSDAQSKTLWRHSFAEMLGSYGPDPSESAWIGDIDGDGEVETLFVLRPWDSNANSDVLVCLSNQGTEKWRFMAGRMVATATQLFEPVFRLSAFFVGRVTSNQALSIVLVSRHFRDFPCQVSLLSAKGELQREYWHAGWIGCDRYNTLRIGDLNQDGMNEIYLGGESSSHHQATFVVLDPNRFGGASREENPDFQLLGIGQAEETGRLLMPRSCINQTLEHSNQVGLVLLQTDQIVLGVCQSSQINCLGIEYHLNPDLSLRRLVLAEAFPAAHKQMAASGQLDHSMTDLEEAELQHITNLTPVSVPLHLAGAARND